MEIAIETLHHSLAIELVDSLKDVLDSRLHKRVYLGEEFLVKGSLSRALKIDSIKRLLNSPSIIRQEKGLEMLSLLWSTLSQATKERTLSRLGWYEPKHLKWDDPRSNRLPFTKI